MLQFLKDANLKLERNNTDLPATGQRITGEGSWARARGQGLIGGGLLSMGEGPITMANEPRRMAAGEQLLPTSQPICGISMSPYLLFFGLSPEWQ